MSFEHSVAVAGKRYWVYGPLAFSSFYFLPFIFSFKHFTAFTITASLLQYGVFVWLYLKASSAIGEKALLPVLGIVTIALFGTYFTPGTQALYGFAAYFCGFNFAKNKGYQGLVGIVFAVILSSYLFNLFDAYYIAPALLVSVGLFYIGSAERTERIHQTQHAKSQQQIEQLAAVAERERIARDLHDLAGHSLSSIALKAELAEKLLAAGASDKAQREVAAVAQLSRSLLSDIRMAVTNLKSFKLLTQLAELKQKLIDKQFTVSITNQLPSISSNTENELTLIVTEACTNILRYSNGDQVEITLTPHKIAITDNGTQQHTFMKGNGLSGIEERLAQLGGTLSIERNAGFGLVMEFKEGLQ